MKNYLTLGIVAVFSLFFISSTIDLDNLFDYENQTVPTYITKDNTAGNQITDEGATLGRVLFYDKNLSFNNTIACASCHKQEFAFSDTAIASVGVDGTTGRHSMRLINARFGDETNFFWDERAVSLEDQTTKPIQDHIEMGFSGTNNDPDLDSLIRKLSNITYYNQLFDFVYGDTIITEERIQNSLAQFIRSIQSFDSKYDVGRAQVNNNGQPFPNYTNAENNGKTLFQAPPQFDNNGNRTAGGAGCQGCHGAPEFNIVPNTQNNGVVGNLSGGFDFTNTRSPSLRDLLDNNENPNGPFMHDGSLATLEEVIDHYDSIEIIGGNNNIAPRLTPGGNPQRLNLTTTEKDELITFLKTLTGSDVYTNPKWSDPFTNGTITISSTASISINDRVSDFSIYPNPTTEGININYSSEGANKTYDIYNASGSIVKKGQVGNYINVSELQTGTYFLKIDNKIKQFIKR